MVYIHAQAYGYVSKLHDQYYYHVTFKLKNDLVIFSSIAILMKCSDLR